MAWGSWVCRLTAVVILTGALPVCAEDATLRVLHPIPDTPVDNRDDFPLAVLRLALEHSGRRFQLVPAVRTLPQARSIQELANDSGVIDILWTMTSRERERQLLPVRIPLDKGLLGWRLCLVRAAQRNLFEGVRDVTGLRAFTAGQGLDWPDVDVLRAAGLPVLTAEVYGSLFAMLDAGRFDYFPRSLDEVGPELARTRASGIDLDPYLVLHYPTAKYFFVNRANTVLAEVVRGGFEKAIADGSFQRLFEGYYDEDIRRFDLRHRQVIELANPDLPDDLPLERRELWFHHDDHGGAAAAP